VRPEGLGKLKTLIYLIGSRTRDLPACSVVPQLPSKSFPIIYLFVYAVVSISIVCIQLNNLIWDLVVFSSHGGFSAVTAPTISSLKFQEGLQYANYKIIRQIRSGL
jgi:hypothetical protein